MSQSLHFRVWLLLAFVVQMQILFLVAITPRAGLTSARTGVKFCPLSLWHKKAWPGTESENLLAGYGRSKCCTCLYCILQVHNQHMAFWVSVGMATLWVGAEPRTLLESPIVSQFGGLGATRQAQTVTSGLGGQMW